MGSVRSVVGQSVGSRVRESAAIKVEEARRIVIKRYKGTSGPNAGEVDYKINDKTRRVIASSCAEGATSVSQNCFPPRSQSLACLMSSPIFRYQSPGLLIGPMGRQGMPIAPAPRSIVRAWRGNSAGLQACLEGSRGTPPRWLKDFRGFPVETGAGGMITRNIQPRHLLIGWDDIVGFDSHLDPSWRDTQLGISAAPTLSHLGQIPA